MPNQISSIAIVFSLFLFMTPLFGQAQLSPEQSTMLNAKFNKFYVGEAQFSSSQWQSLRSPSEFSEVNLNIYGKNYTLELHDAGMYSDNYFSSYYDDQDNRVKSLDRPILLQGQIKGNNASSVRLTLNDDFIYGVIKDGDKEYFVEPLHYYLDNVDKARYIAYEKNDAVLEELNDFCAVKQLNQKSDELSHNHSHGKMVGLCFEVEIALAADFLMYQDFGSNVFNTNNHINGVLNNVQGNYDDEFADELKFIIVTNFVASSAAIDPWTTSTAAGTVLSDFRSWGPSGFGITHDVATLWTGRNFDGGTIGIAYLGVICGFSRYNVCENFSSNASLLRVVWAHELGHNFDAVHDGGGSGFIMAPSVNNTTVWSGNSIADIENHYLSRTCLSSCPSSGAPPIADFAFTVINDCTPGEVVFTDISTNAPSSWSWTFTGGSPSSSNQQNPTVFYNTPGTYTVSLTVTNAAGTATETKTNIITINADADATFSFNISGSTVFFNSVNDPGTNYTWSFGDGNTDFIANPIYTYSQDGTYEVFLQAANSCGTELTSEFVTIATPPQSGFTADIVEGCSPLVVQFSNNATTNVVNYEWTFEGGDPMTSTDPNPLVNFQNPGDFDVSLKVTNAQGTDTAAEADYILVNPSPAAGFTQVVSGAAVSFTNTSTGATTYSWDFGDGNTSVDPSPLHTYTASGNYTVTLTATNPDCGDDVFTNTVEIILQPVSSFSTSSSTTGCSSFTVDFIDNSTSNPTSWLWTFPGGTPSTSTDQNPSVVYATPGLYDVTLEVTNANGSDTNTLTDYVEVLNDATADASFNIVSQAANNTTSTVSFMNQSSFGLTYAWDFGDGNISTDENPTHTYAQQGIYTVELTTTNNCNSDTETLMLDLYTAPVADFMVLNNGICAGDLVDFNNSSSTNVTTYAWTFPGANPSSSTDINPSVVYDTPGTYDVSLVVSNPSFQDQITITSAVVVGAAPEANFTTQSDQTLYNFINLSQNATNYTWDFGDGSPGSAMEAPTHEYAQEGDYTVILTANGPCGSSIFENTITVSTRPTANFTSGSQTICEGESISFDNLSSSNADSYEWTFPGGTPATSTAENPEVSYAQDGTYDVTLSISGAGGTDEITLTDYITVISEPEGDFTATVDGVSTSFSPSFSNADSYLWDFGDGITSIETSPNHTFGSNATYLVSVTVTNACGSTTTNSEITISAYPTAAFDLGTMVTGCSPFTFSLTNTSSEATSFLWTIDGPEVVTSTDENPSFTLNTAGEYSVTLRASNTFGSEETVMMNVINVLNSPVASFTTQANATEISFTNTSEYADSYLWDFGDGNTDTSENPVHTYSEDGNYTVTLTVTGPCGTETITQEVSAVTTTPIINFALSNTSGCVPFVLEVSDMTGNDPTSWSWEFEGGTPVTSTDQNPTVSYTEAGTYDISVTVTNASGTSTVVREDIVVIEDLPVVDFTASISSGIVDFTNSSSNGTVTWDFGDGNQSQDPNPTHIYDELGTYEVTLTVVNNCGESSFTQEVEISLLSATEELDDPSLVTFFPNPTTGLINVNGLELFDEDYTLEIYNATGQKIVTNQNALLLRAQGLLDLSSFDAQLFIIRISDSEKFVTRKVLLID